MRLPQISLDMFAAIVCIVKKEHNPRRDRARTLSSAVNKRIKFAERIAGTKLLTASEGGLLLTEAGQLFYSEAIRSLEHALLAEQKVAAYLMLNSRSLLVGHSNHLPPRLLGILLQTQLDLPTIVLCQLRLIHS